MRKYAVAYCNPDGCSFSENEPYIEDAGYTMKDIREVLARLTGQRMLRLIPFVIEDKLDFYTWDYVIGHKICVE
jgi:hypothetical protein